MPVPLATTLQLPRTFRNLVSHIRQARFYARKYAGAIILTSINKISQSHHWRKNQREETMDSKNKAGQKGTVNHSKHTTRPGTEQTHSGTSIKQHEGEKVHAPKQGEVKKEGQVKSGKK
jgi:hypothetical protein